MGTEWIPRQAQSTEKEQIHEGLTKYWRKGKEQQLVVKRTDMSSRMRRQTTC